MDLRFLKTFVAVAEAGGMASACGRLHVSQPAASRRIAALESELGVRLFDRSGGRMKLSSEGEDLLQRSRRLLAEAELLSERARALKSGSSGPLRFGCTPQVIEAFAAAFISQYQQSHPDVEVQLVEDASGSLPAFLERGEIHFAQIPAGDERFRWRLLYPTHALAIMSTRHRLARRRCLEIAELAGEPLLLLNRESQARRWIDAACNVVHMRAQVAHESAVPHTLVALAASGRGVALLPSNVRIQREGICAQPVLLRGQPIGRWSSIAWHPQRFLPRYAEQFLERFVRYAERRNPGRQYTRQAPALAPPREPA